MAQRERGVGTLDRMTEERRGVTRKSVRKGSEEREALDL
jgi:hypothetical protein